MASTPNITPAILQQEILELQHAVAELSNRPQPRSRPVLPDPEKFNGTPHRFDTWLPSIEAKLLVDGDAIGSSVAQFYYVYLNLESQAQALVLPQLAYAKAIQT